MKRLFVIGNGFDSAHKLSTSYYAFRDYLKKNNPDFYYRVTRFNLFVGDDLWKNFENNLAEIDMNEIYQTANNACNTIEEMDYDSNSGDNIGFAVAYELDYYKELTSNLYDWIQSIDYSKAIHIKNTSIFENANFLTFNYTLTLERFYSIKPRNICHIHGVITGIHTNLIMGHGVDDDYPFYDNDEEEWKKTSPRYIEARISIKKYITETRKPVDKIMKKNADFFNSNKNCDEIYILGFSFGEVDIPYIEKIISDSSNAKVVVTYYKAEEKDEFENIISRYTNNYCLKKMNEIFEIN